MLDSIDVPAVRTEPVLIFLCLSQYNHFSATLNLYFLEVGPLHLLDLGDIDFLRA